MLENIRIHLHEDDKQQEKIERNNAQLLETVFKSNRRAFLKFAPGLRGLLDKAGWESLGVFFNKNGEPNILNQLEGTAFYDLEPKSEVTSQVDAFFGNPISISIPHSSAANPHDEQRCLVILGLGIGYHLPQLIKESSCKYVIIYEPEVQFFLASCHFLDWESVLRTADEVGIMLFFQIGEDAKKIKSDLIELRQHCKLSKIDFYHHYNYPTFLAIVDHAKYYQDSQFFEFAIEWDRGEKWSKYLPFWTPPPNQTLRAEMSKEALQRYNNNIMALRGSFPQIAKEYEKYTPSRWEPVELETGEISMIHRDTQILFSSRNPRQAGAHNYQNFSKYPNKDGLILGYNGTKLLPYLHYQFVSEVSEILDQIEDEKSELPQDVKSVILFGIANGYHLHQLTSNHKIEALLICEPEPDFFYSSLFAIDFESLLDDFNKREARLYFNIGDDGSHLYSDLMHQFHAIGPYVLQDTYFYQSYYRKDFADQIAALREQLQVVVSAGEYFDHARYGIEHTRQLFKKGCYVLKKGKYYKQNADVDQTPVFIVGNGPSLDKEITMLKSLQDEVIIVSCGTTIKALAKHNIRPDFHVEIEQNRSTYDWLERANCTDLLKQTRLLTCNGIHPDVAWMFKEVLICLKNGESSTEIAELAIGKNKFETLEFAYPTVTNLALNAIIKLKFKNVYLLGIDLAFLSETEHHSIDSGYYDEQGNELYVYAEKNQLGVSVPGNFGGFLKTKYEFKLSKNCLENLLKTYDFNCFNCSHGAYIQNTTPLKSRDINISMFPPKNLKNLQQYVNNAFTHSSEFLSNTEGGDIVGGFNMELYQQDIENCINLIERLQCDNISIDQFIAAHKQKLIDSYSNKNSLFFYLLFGSTNYALSAFSKVNSNDISVKIVGSLCDAWRAFLERVRTEYCLFPNSLDFSYSFSQAREKLISRHHNYSSPVFLNLRQQDVVLLKTELNNLNEYGVDFDTTFISNSEYLAVTLFVYPDSETLILKFLDSIAEPHKIIIVDANQNFFSDLVARYSRHTFLLVLSPFSIENQEDLKDASNGMRPFCFDQKLIQLIPKVLGYSKSNIIIVPKLRYAECAEESLMVEQAEQFLSSLKVKNSYFHVFPDYCCFEMDKSDDLLDCIGNRARPVPVSHGVSELIAYKKITKKGCRKREYVFQSSSLQWFFKAPR